MLRGFISGLFLIRYCVLETIYAVLLAAKLVEILSLNDNFQRRDKVARLANQRPRRAGVGRLAPPQPRPPFGSGRAIKCPGLHVKKVERYVQ